MAIESTPPQNEPPKQLENRTFGLIFAGIFLVIATLPLLFDSGFRNWAGIVAAVFASAALVIPVALTPFNKAFAAFGKVMHKITNPILMGLVFFLTVLPTGIIMKLLGKDPMHRKLNPKAETYWISREPDAITKESFNEQF